MKEIFLAIIIIIYGDHTSSSMTQNFYNIQDCQKYLIQSHHLSLKGTEVMILDDNLVWSFKKVVDVQQRCESSNLKMQDKK